MRRMIPALALLIIASPAFAGPRSVRPDILRGPHHVRWHSAKVHHHRHADAGRRRYAERPVDRRRMQTAWRRHPWTGPGANWLGWDGGALRRQTRVRGDVWHPWSHDEHSVVGRSYAAVTEERSRGDLDGMIARHAQMNGVPESLVRRVVKRESGGNPRAVGRGGAMGLMQIKSATARAMGYGGPPSGLLDAETNLTYAVRYLAGAYRVAGGNSDRAVSNYARGYHGVAARRVTWSPARRNRIGELATY
jgi:hypothetical protein